MNGTILSVQQIADVVTVLENIGVHPTGIKTRHVKIDLSENRGK